MARLGAGVWGVRSRRRGSACDATWAEAVSGARIVVVLDRVTLRDELRAIVDEVIAERDAPVWVAVNTCGLPPRSLRAAARRGELAIRRVGRADFVERGELAAWVARQPGPDTAPASGVRCDDDELGDLLSDETLEATTA